MKWMERNGNREKEYIMNDAAFYRDLLKNGVMPSVDTSLRMKIPGLMVQFFARHV